MQTNGIYATPMQTAGVFTTLVQLRGVSAITHMIAAIFLPTEIKLSLVDSTKNVQSTLPEAGSMSYPNKFMPKSNNFTPNSNNPFRHTGLDLKS